jgi:hypothetical protein
VSISSRIFTPTGLSCGANQQRTPLLCKSAWRLGNVSSFFVQPRLVQMRTSRALRNG